MKNIFLAAALAVLVAACGTSGTSSPSTTLLPSLPADATPAPSEEVSEFDILDGTWLVGEDIQPGTYITFLGDGTCYWETDSETSNGGVQGAVGDINANDNPEFQGIVTITKRDYAFHSSRCSGWYDIERYKFLFGAGQATTYVSQEGFLPGDGQFLVGYDVEPGTYRSDASAESCYWARLSGFTGDIEEVISNDFTSGGSQLVVIRNNDVGFETSGCGSWDKIK